MVKTYSSLILGLCFALSSSAQLFYNNGADVAVTGGGVLYVNGAIENAYGLFSNAGETTTRGYFRNGSTATGGNAAGEYIVYGDWENNDIFTAHNSNVILRGNTQLITGSENTTFHDLTLETSGTVKRMTLDATTNHQLVLNDCELATGDYRMYVTNPVNASITRLGGFVSSTGPGRLVRSTNSTTAYLFPTGWNNNGTILYRPAEITPSVVDDQTFEARMIFGDPTLEGYDTSVRAGNVIEVNGKFAHLLKQNGSTEPSVLSLYYDQAADGTWGSIARWQNVPQWEDLLNTTMAYNNLLTPGWSRTKEIWIDNGNQAHALIKQKELKNIYAFPNVFAPGSSNTANATFHIIDQYSLATVVNMKIFNRWGQPVFDSERDKNTCTIDGGSTTYCWDGTFQGKLQPMGNYVYVATVKNIDTGEVKSTTGDLSLLW